MIQKLKKKRKLTKKLEKLRMKMRMKKLKSAKPEDDEVMPQFASSSSSEEAEDKTFSSDTFI